jgi:hypothetical protein
MQREERYDRSVLGAGLNLSGKSLLAARELNWMLGLEQVRESTDYGYWDGLLDRRRTGPALNDRNTRLDNTAIYGQAGWQPTAWLQTTAALRWDHFDGRCRLLGAEAGGDECNRMQGRSHASPKLGHWRSSMHGQPCGPAGRKALRCPATLPNTRCATAICMPISFARASWAWSGSHRPIG